MKDFVKGIFSHSIFKSDKGYIIGLWKVKETNIVEMKDYVNRTITITGYFADLNENEKYIMYGEIVNHPKYGFQYSVNDYERVKPEDSDAIIEFLSSGLFKGIGEKLATSIVETLGDQAINKIIEDKACLYLVPHLSENKINLIYNTIIKYEESHEIIVKLNELGFSMKNSMNIYNMYKSNTIRIIENNIYRIIDDIDDINFLVVDQIALQYNDDIYNINRIKAIIIYVMKNLSFSKGDTYLYYGEIYEGVSYYLKSDVDSNILDEAISELDGELKLKIDDDKYYLYEDYDSEEYIIDKLNILINKETTDYKDLDFNATEIQQKLADPDNISLLKGVMEKLG